MTNVKVFTIEQQEEVNAFTKTVTVVDNGIHVTGSDHIVVFYEDDTTYEKEYLANLIKKIEREKFFEHTRLVSAEIELAKAQEKISIEDIVEDVEVTKTGYKKHKNPTEIESLIQKKQEAVDLCKEHIELFDIKLNAYKSELAKYN